MTKWLEVMMAGLMAWSVTNFGDLYMFLDVYIGMAGAISGMSDGLIL